MRLALAALACSLFPSAAAAGGGAAPAASRPVSPVIGGTDAKAGKWPDVAAILFPDGASDDPLCSGVLVAPTIVLTAGHCFDPLAPPLPDNVLIGTADLARPGDGETIAIKQGFVYPDFDTTEDIAVLVLEHPSSRAPRKIVDGWARTDLTDGAAVALVGFGAINDLGDEFVDALQEASSTITDADCSVSLGCNADAQPAGELGAGGMGVDTCPGDSGGPLYLMTAYGPVLAGITSRSYDDAPVPCSDGGIYVRPDKILDWIEMVAGVPVARVGRPEADPIDAVHGDAGETRIQINDPSGDTHSFEIVTPPAHGTAKVRDDGAVRVCVDPDAVPSDDQMTVRITDTRHANRILSVAIQIHIEDGTPPAKCDVNAFREGGGCCDAGGHPGGAIPLALGVLALFRRRRRPPRG